MHTESPVLLQHGSMIQTFFFHTLISFITLGSNLLCCTFYFTSKYLRVFIRCDILWWSWRTVPNSFRWTSLPRSDNVHAQYIKEWITERGGERESAVSYFSLLSTWLPWKSLIKLIETEMRERWAQTEPARLPVNQLLCALGTLEHLLSAADHSASSVWNWFLSS